MMRKIIHSVSLIIIALTMITSCISPEETNYLQTINIPYPRQGYQEYRLQSNDQIECAIYTRNKEFGKIFNKVIGTDEKTSSVPYTVYANGNILLPYFGEIQVKGLTIDEAESHIQSVMKEAITDVEVKITLRNNYFYFLSDQGSYRGKQEIYKENMTIFQALAQINSSEITDRGINLKNVRIVRKDNNGNTITKSFDLRSKDVLESEFYYVQPNDMYYFPKSSKSFFNINSAQEFFSTIITPVMFLIMVTSVKFD